MVTDVQVLYQNLQIEKLVKIQILEFDKMLNTIDSRYITVIYNLIVCTLQQLQW